MDAIKFPVAIVLGGALIGTYSAPTPFVGPDGNQHPASAWALWTSQDWETMCPGWRILPLIDSPPTNPAKRCARKPDADWRITDDAVEITYDQIDLGADELAGELANAQNEALKRVNGEAGAARAQFITVAIGQEGTYLDKAAEAEAFAADPGPSAGKYPYLYEEAAATDTPIEEVAIVVLATAQAWRRINAQIEGLRKGACKRVKCAKTQSDVEAVFPIGWPSPS